MNVVTLCKTRQKGASIVESLILMVVLALAFGAIFTMMTWAHKTHIHSRHYRESRELLFSFVQVFDAMFRPDNINLTGPALVSLADNAFSEAVTLMGGTQAGVRRAQIRGFTVDVEPIPILTPNERTLALNVLISSSGRAWVNMQGNNARSFNATINKTVQDWSEPDAP